jgi:hypothetical protein
VTDQFFSSKPWDECFLTFSVSHEFDWVVLDTERRLAEISFCDNSLTCGNTSTEPMALSSIILFTEESEINFF